MKKLTFVIFILLFFMNLIYAKDIIVLEVDGIINPVSASYLIDNISKANLDSNFTECIIIQMDTPGGLMTSMRKIIKSMMNSELPIIVYVSPQGARAGSAGVFITYASDLAAMAPGTNIGAAHPVNVGGGFSFNKDTTDTDILKEKVTNDAVAFIKSLAEKHNRNAEWAEKSVRKSASITEVEAIENNVIELIADDLDDLIEKLDGHDVKGKLLSTKKTNLVFKEFGVHRKILDIISEPNVAYILMILGFWGLVFEIRNPGAVFPGVFGAVCLILAFFAFQILPINYTGVALIFVAIIFFILEVFVTSFGLLTIGGIIIMTLGSMMLIDFSEAPKELFAISLNVIIPIVVLTALFFIFAFAMALKAMKNQATTGQEGMVGLEGICLSDITEKSGQVRVHGEIWNAISSETIEQGDIVIVEKIENMKLTVFKKT